MIYCIENSLFLYRKFPQSRKKNTCMHVRRRNKALIAINEAVAPWMWIGCGSFSSYKGSPDTILENILPFFLCGTSVVSILLILLPGPYPMLGARPAWLVSGHSWLLRA